MRVENSLFAGKAATAFARLSFAIFRAVRVHSRLQQTFKWVWRARGLIRIASTYILFGAARSLCVYQTSRTFAPIAV